MPPLFLRQSSVATVAAAGAVRALCECWGARVMVAPSGVSLDEDVTKSLHFLVPQKKTI